MDLRWTVLKRLAESKYAKLTILVPLIGWFLVINDHFSAVLARLVGYAPIGEPSWRVYAFHAGLSIFGLGVGLFYLLCPSPVKNTNGYNDFCDSERVTLVPDRLDQYIEYGKRRGLPNAAHLKKPTFSEFTNIEDSRDLWYSRNMTYILNVLDTYYKSVDISLPYARYIVATCFGIGGLLAFIPTANGIIWSFTRFFKLIWLHS